MRSPIIRDPNQAIDVDPVLITMQRVLDNAGGLKQTKQLAAFVKKTRDEIKTHVEDPILKVRMIPPQVLETMRAKWSPSKGAKRKSQTREDQVREHRDIIRWCLVGIRGVEFVVEDAEHAGRRFVVASEEMVDIIHSSGWLDTLAAHLVEFSVLTESDKKK